MDNYNTRYKDKGEFDVEKGRYFNSEQKISRHYWPTEGETVDIWLRRLGRSVYESKEQNIAVHINGVRGPWYTHRASGSCFMCDDLTFIGVLYDTLSSIADLVNLSEFVFYFKDNCWLIRKLKS